MWSSRLFWRILVIYGGFSMLVTVGCFVAVLNWQRQQVMEQVQQRLHDSAVILRSQVLPELRTAPPASGNFQPLLLKLGEQTSTRFTLIGADGVVLADSDIPHHLMQNHIDRPEIRQAIQEGHGSARRRSSTLDIEMVYVAVQIPGEGTDPPLAYARVAMSMEAINQQMSSIQRRIGLIVGVMSLLLLVLTYAIAGGLIRPLQMLTSSAQAISAGRYENPINISSNDEIGNLGRAFDTMRQQLKTQVKELSEQAQRQTTVLRSILDGILVIDAERRVNLVNQSAIRLLGFQTHDPEGSRLDGVITCQPAIDAVSLALATNESMISEFEIPGNELRIVSMQISCLPGSPCPGVVAVVRDVTELRQLETMRRDFAANVSHELKTPLTSIKAYAETLRLGALYDAENNMGFLVRIEEQAERLHLLILDLLQLSRIQSGEEALEIRDVSVTEVIVHSVSSREDAAHAKDIKLTLDSPDHSLMIQADEEGVRTVLDNLIDNAINYTPAQGQVTVRWKKDGDMVLIEVEDTGIGIAVDEQSRVFERFYRVDKARSRALGGTGLGLSIVKHMTQSLGGSVGLRSELGKGSTFQLRFKIATPGEQRAETVRGATQSLQEDD